VTDLVGQKVTAKARQNRIRRELLAAIGLEEARAAPELAAS
jgi:hypothetical protein